MITTMTGDNRYGTPTELGDAKIKYELRNRQSFHISQLMKEMQNHKLELKKLVEH